MSLYDKRNTRAGKAALAAAIGVTFTLIGPAWADDIVVPSDPIEKAAFEVLEKHCARCHQDGKLVGRERPAKNFANVLRINELADTPSRILPGNPYGSKMFKQIVDKEMPYDTMQEGAAGPDVTEADLKALETWIKALAAPADSRKIAVESATPAAPPAQQQAAAPDAPAPPAQQQAAAPDVPAPPAQQQQQQAAAPASSGPPGAPTPVQVSAGPVGPPAVAGCGAHKYVSPKDIMSLIAADLDAQPKARVETTRYLTLTHLTNLCTKEKSMDVYRLGAIKLLNSVSRSPDVVRLETIDPDRSILRINLNDLGWEKSDWDDLIATYPYAVQPETQLAQLIENATGTKMAYARADWVAFVASRPGVYEKLLKLPTTFQALAKEHAVDLDGNIRKFIAQRAGFQKSGVSRNNRLIERHPSRNGYFWTSYDFAGNRSEQSLFERPLGPTGPNAFKHDGGESIFSLPNGFQAYYLNTADGKSLDKGPTSIVQDPGRKDLQVTNGISCMGCHDQGMRKAKDDVRQNVLVAAGRSFAKDVRDKVDALYPPHEKMDGIIAGDGKRFNDAMARAGLLTEKGIDPESKQPTLVQAKLNGIEMINALSDRYEADVDINLAAAEIGLSKEEFIQRSGDVDRKIKPIIRRLDQDIVPRDQFETIYKDLAAIADLEPVALKGTALKAARAESVGTDLTLIADKDTYKVGDTPTFTVISKNDCFLTLTNIDSKGGEGTVIFPNKFQQDNKIKAKVEIKLPGASAPFRYRMQDPGTEEVIAVCTEAKVVVDGIKQDFKKEDFTAVNNYTRSVANSLSRKIAVESAAPGAKVAVAKVVAPAKGREISRAAIKISVQ